MEQKKINIAELLKDCPSGMELDSPMYDNLYFDCVEIWQEKTYAIKCYIERGVRTSVRFTKYGQYNKDTKCVIFPKGKTTWEGFVPPGKFKEGDVIYTDKFVAILSNITERGSVWYHCYYCIDTEMFKAKRDFGIGNINCDEFRFATEEEKEKLFQAIKDNGYKWNAETKSLEKLVKPKFKVGDKIQDEDGYKVKITEVNIEDECYGYESIIAKGIGGIAFSKQDNWELVPNKFDINTLIPFESRVLVRYSMDGIWKPAVFGFRNGYNDNAFYIVGGSCWNQCIPYLNNEHLCGTTNDCDEFYKNWE